MPLRSLSHADSLDAAWKLPEDWREPVMRLLDDARADVPRTERVPRRDGPAPVPIHDANGAASTDAPLFYTLAELHANPSLLVPPEPLAPPLAYKGRVTLLAAPPKKGKSTLLGHSLAAASRAGLRCGLLTLDEALGETVARLIRFGADPDRIFLTDQRPSDLPAWVDATGGLDVLAIDALQHFAPTVKSGDAAGWTAVFAPVKAVARTRGCAVVVLHHTRRSDDQYRDSSAIGAEPDLIIEMKPRGTERVATCQGRFRAAGFTVSLDADERVIVSTDSARPQATGDAPLDLQITILRLLQSAEPEGLRAAQWQRLAEEEARISRPAFYRARRALHLAGALLYASRLYRVSPSGSRLLAREEV